MQQKQSIAGMGRAPGTYHLPKSANVVYGVEQVRARVEHPWFITYMYYSVRKFIIPSLLTILF